MAYKAVAEQQTGARVIQFILDWGGEFINVLLGTQLRSMGIVLHLTAGHAPQQNGVAERGNRTVSTKARAMMLEASLPLTFWYLSCSAAVFLINRSITAAFPDQKRPFEMWHYRNPAISHLKILGCLAYCLIRKELRQSEFYPVSSEGVLVGFDQDNFDYLIFDLQSCKIHTSHNVTFNKSQFPFDKSTDLASNSHNTVKYQFMDDSEDDKDYVLNPGVNSLGDSTQNTPDHHVLNEDSGKGIHMQTDVILKNGDDFRNDDSSSIDPETQNHRDNSHTVTP